MTSFIAFRFFFAAFFFGRGLPEGVNAFKRIPLIQRKWQQVIDDPSYRFPGSAWGRQPNCHGNTLTHAEDTLPIPRGEVYKVYLEDAKARLGRNLTGIEIGALHNPAVLPAFATTKYVDFAPLAVLKGIYPDVGDIQAPDIIDTAEDLKTLKDSSYDYVISSHLLEHTRHTVRSLSNKMRVLVPGGVLFVNLPIMCLTFDFLRLLTTVEHLLDEFRSPSLVDKNELEHFREWSLFFVNETVRAHLAANDLKGISVKAKELEKSAKHYHKAKYPIHYHTFTGKSAMSLMSQLADNGPALGFPYQFEIRYYTYTHHEVSFVMVKVA